MRARHLWPLVAIGWAMAAPAASAQPLEGLYIGAAGGVNLLASQRLNSSTSAGVTSPSGPAQGYRTGVAVAGSLGWGFGNGLRLELEGSWRSNTRSATSAGLPQSGREDKLGAMANLLFDMDLGASATPYIGVGGGWQHTTQRLALESPAGPTRLTGTSGGFGYQAMAGISLRLPGVSGLSATAEYRFMALAGDRRMAGSGPGGAAARVVGEDANHAVMVGLRWAFDAPTAIPLWRAPPPAAPLASASRSYLVFFAAGDAALSDRARQVLGEAAQAFGRVRLTRIDIASSGPAEPELTRRREEAVAGELARLGVTRAAIGIGEAATASGRHVAIVSR